MHIQPQSRYILTCFLLYLIGQFYNPKLAFSFRLKSRSVEECSALTLESSDHKEKNGDGVSDSTSSAYKCHEHCRLSYIESSAHMKDLNYGKLISRIVETKQSKQRRCCCQFDAFWPQEVNDQWHNDVLRAKNNGNYLPFNCAPLIITFRTQAKTREAFEQMCRYLSKSRPLSLLELTRFIQSTAHLQLVKSKHISIMQALSQKQVRKMKFEDAALWSKALKSPLLDKNRWSVTQYEGIRFETKELVELRKITKFIRNQISSSTVNRALDEYVISFAMANVAAAAHTIQSFNEAQGVPSDLLLGRYDKYNTFDSDVKNEPFRLVRTDCKLLSSTRLPIRIFMDEIRQSLGTMNERGMFDKMLREFEPAKTLVQSQKLYEKLLEINCKPNN